MCGFESCGSGYGSRGLFSLDTGCRKVINIDLLTFFQLSRGFFTRTNSWILMSIYMKHPGIDLYQHCSNLFSPIIHQVAMPTNQKNFKWLLKKQQCDIMRDFIFSILNNLSVKLGQNIYSAPLKWFKTSTAILASTFNFNINKEYINHVIW